MATEEQSTDRAFRVLIADDEIAIAMELEAHLRDVGFVPVGPAVNASDLQGLAESEDCDGAILDFGLLGLDPDTALAPLVKRGMPFIIITGYDDGDGWHPPNRGVRIMKPVHLPDVVQTLRELILRHAEQPSSNA